MNSAPQKDLARLLRKAQAGDKFALQQLCKELEGYVRGFFWKKFRDNVIVDDLCQETFIRSAADKNNLAKKVIFRGKFGVSSLFNVP